MKTNPESAQYGLEIIFKVSCLVHLLYSCGVELLEYCAHQFVCKKWNHFTVFLQLWSVWAMPSDVEKVWLIKLTLTPRSLFCMILNYEGIRSTSVASFLDLPQVTRFFFASSIYSYLNKIAFEIARDSLPTVNARAEENKKWHLPRILRHFVSHARARPPFPYPAVSSNQTWSKSTSFPECDAVHQNIKLPSSIFVKLLWQFTVPIYTPGWGGWGEGETLRESSVLPKNTAQWPWSVLEPRPLDPEFIA